MVSAKWRLQVQMPGMALWLLEKKVLSIGRPSSGTQDDNSSYHDFSARLAISLGSG
jgi:hypothetical protein